MGVGKVIRLRSSKDGQLYFGIIVDSCYNTCHNDIDCEVVWNDGDKTDECFEPDEEVGSYHFLYRGAWHDIVTNFNTFRDFLEM